MANDSLDFVQRGKVSIVRRQYADAVKICRLGLLAHPTLLEGRLVLGMALTALARWDEVLAEMRVALEVDSQSALAWLLKGEALVGKGDFSQAEGTLRRAKELDPSNTKADQLLAEIQVARAAGFEGIPAEPTDTKVYPAKASPDDSKLAEVAAPLTSGSIADLPEGTGEHSIEYDDDATEVDPDPSDQVILGAARKPQKRAPAPRPAPVPVPADSGSSTIEKRQKKREDDSETDTYLPPRGSSESSYEPPAADDYAERPRPAVPSLSEESSIPGLETKTPIEVAKFRPAPTAGGGGMQSLAGPDGRAHAPRPNDQVEPSIELSGADLLAVASESDEQFDLSDEPDQDVEEQTRQRMRRQVDENAGTRPETPEPVQKRQRTLRPFEPGAEARPDARPKSPRPSASPDGAMRADDPRAAPRPGRMPTWNPNAPTGTTDNPAGVLARAGRNDVHERTGTPGVVRVPVRPRRAPGRSVVTRLRNLLPGGGSLALLITALVAVVAVGVVTGLVVREWRMRARVAKRHELARQKLASGNYPGYQAAELLYRQILTERDDPQARALRARTLAEMSFEFGDPPDGAARAVAALGELDTPEANQARVYLAMSRGELDRAGRLAIALRRKSADAAASYLVGRTELLLERPESAADALRAAADKEPKDPVILHGLGLAEAAARRDDKANEAYRRALQANANHIATIIDRAVLQVRRAQGPGNESVREGARGALEGVVSKLVGDSSPGQLARAFLGLAELELARGDLEAARHALASAAAKRRDGDTQLSEELAAAFARAFELDSAEKEANRAVAGFGGTGRLAPRLVLAEVALRRGRPAQALATIEEAGTSRPEALVMRSQANLQLGRKEPARLDAEAALRVQPDSVPARVALARVEIADGHPERAVRELDKLERTGKSAEVAAALGQLHSAKNPERARMWFNEALKRDALLLDARLALARMLREAGKLDDARTELTTLLQLNPAFAPGRRELATVALDQGDAVGARDQFDALADKEPDHDTLLGAARAHLALGDGTGAEERVRKAQKLAPAGVSAEESTAVLARALLMRHQPEEAVKELRKVIIGAQRGETAGLLMMAYLDLDQQDKAAAVRLIVPPRLRVSPELITGRARLQVERGRDVAAESLAMEALSRLQKPTSPRWVKAEALAVLGRSRWEQGAFGAALRTLRSATDLDPKNARAHYYLGLVLEDLRKLPDAMTSLETATKVDPKYADAHYYLGRLRQETKDTRAAESFQAYLDVAPKGIYADEARRQLTEKGAPLRKRRRFR